MAAAEQDPDEAWMARAVTLAEGGRGTVSPNPMVGAVLVRDGRVVGEGFHRAAGQPHAEAVALAAAGAAAAGATCYVTLEPCAHHGRTPPCADALVAAGVARVVAAVPDPDPRVDGAGLARLRAAGVAVAVGAGAEAAATQNAAYLTHRRLGRPRVTLKAAASLDGKVAAPDGTSKWITGPAARADAHRLRAEADAVMVGAGTALADDPRLTVRLPGWAGRQPLRVLVDAAGRVGADGHLFDGEAETLVATTPAAPPAAVEAWKAAGAEVLIVQEDADRRRSRRAGPGPGGAGGAGADGRGRAPAPGQPVGGRAGRPAGLVPGPAGHRRPGRPRAARRRRGGDPGRRPPAAAGLGRPPGRRPADRGVPMRQGGSLMFTGIVEGTGTVAALAAAADGSGARLEVEAPWLAGELRLGESVAVNGCCVTVAEPAAAGFAADLVAETLRRTALGGLAAGARVNLERPLALGGRLGGHLVQGHVDGVAKVLERTPVGEGEEVRIELPADLERYVVEKGSIAVDGVSLTVAGVGPGWFSVALVPHTLEVTTLGDRRPGDPVQLEVDVVAKYVERLVAR